ncbi:UDP-N-acetylmuramoyl-L-alanyl-D-glutamate--2,6-diaminopimelate ligase [Paenisporosarcina indica]|uniref:UDP-N-acetylmuramoyl-L-alanyl-D-glutamate--2, 6-diaminopimelate ligase n=1 Tax=Paenisporosarcina indica TaxID=650093 RepID=UPI00095021F2|nr:UDP-N-acetylmuramoyl-L-alanyl-D-glutamate--2,6-diaminopimelate ligase [Paenisporosarcina indica]
MAFVIADLIKDWPCTWLHGSFSERIYGVKDDSRHVQAGDIFVVIKGKQENGASFINEAIQNGAVCIITEDREDYYLTDHDVSFGIVPNTRTFLSHASSRINGEPSQKLHVVAVTGTNGKTTVSHFIGQILTLLGYQTAVIGTLGLFINGKKVEGDFPSLTTWSATYLHETLALLLRRGITHVIIEASSMGLAQHRLDNCHIQQGVFLNIGHDHLEDHEGIDAYKRAKCKLITLAKRIVVNEDDPFWVEQGLQSNKELRWFGKQLVELDEIKSNSMKIRVVDGARNYVTEVQFTGVYNTSNIAAAIATVVQLGVPMSSVIPILQHLTLPLGRFQFVCKQPFQVVIDYAHTPEALQHLLSSAAQITKGRLLVVFGCGGDRDHAKRSEMGEIAALYAQYMWVTSDNPRSEDPLTICQQIIKGLPESKTIHIETDRASAIEKALNFCRPGDLLCIAGKGHESTQHIGSDILPFSDERTVLNLLSSMSFSWNNEE